MKPSIDTLSQLCPEADQSLVRQHLDQLDASYFEQFPPKDVAAHIRALAGLSSERPVDVIIQRTAEHEAECTVLGFDYPFAFSVITGVLASMGLSINSGEVFTYRRAASASAGVGARPARRMGSWHQRRRASTTLDTPTKRRRIIDYFRVTLPDDAQDDRWRQTLDSRLTEAITLLARREEEAADRAKKMVNEWVTRHLERTPTASEAALDPVRISFEQTDDQRNCMTIRAQDTPAFLYTLSTAMSLQNLSIERVRIRTAGRVIEDEIHFVGKRGEPITDQATLDRVRFTVLLTKQFSYFLDRAPDPFAALSRFEQLVEDILEKPEAGHWLEALAAPQAMRKLARLLGASDFLWEDFIRTQYESMLPMFEDPDTPDLGPQSKEDLARALDEALDGAVGLAEQSDRLNRFKDRQAFLIDLDHILNPSSEFEAFSRRLTDLAELLVGKATQCVYDDLARSYGEPREDDGAPATLAVFGLGKLGGVALGYASDIEVLFVYSNTGKTSGGKRGSISNTEFCTQLVQDFRHFVKAKREGIFEVDLRLRPYGKDGPMASSLGQFEQYYAAQGQAHDVERMALVRLRCIGGDKSLGQRIEAIRDRIVYEQTTIDPSAIWEMRGKQYDQKVSAREINAKYSPGALVDLEYTVQLLQVMYGSHVPSLRTPLIHTALEALQSAGVIDRREADQLVTTYRWMRHIINGLRMLRGSAKDLQLPPLDSQELTHLARRVGYHQIGTLSASWQLLTDAAFHGATVRTFVEKHFARSYLPAPETGNLADLALSGKLKPESRRAILRDRGFGDAQAADETLTNLCRQVADHYALARTLVRMHDLWRQREAADESLRQFGRLVAAADEPDAPVALLDANCRLLEVIAAALATGGTLCDRLVAHPDGMRALQDSPVLEESAAPEEIAPRLLELLSES